MRGGRFVSSTRIRALLFVLAAAGGPRFCDDLRGILAPIGDTETQCNVTALPSNLESAYQEFMAG